jgi:pyruvate kinase
MVKIAQSTEMYVDYEQLVMKKSMHRKRGIASAVGYSTVTSANTLHAKVIVTPTVSGSTARLVSSFRPNVPIIAISPSEETIRKMQIYWGVTPILSETKDTTEDIISRSLDIIKEKKYAEVGDIVVITAGSPAPKSGNGEKVLSNMMRVSVID